MNEVFKYAIRKENNKGKSSKYLIDINNEHIEENIEILEEWSERQVDNILYDSDRDGKDSQTFRNKIMNHQHLYFIIIDNQNNVFGHYHDSVINKIGSSIFDKKIFLFTLFSNGRCEAKKYKPIIEVSTKISNDNGFYEGPDHGIWLKFYNFDNTQHFLWDGIGVVFEGASSKKLIGNTTARFAAKRLLVIEMN